MQQSTTHSPNEEQRLYKKALTFKHTCGYALTASSVRGIGLIQDWRDQTKTQIGTHSSIDTTISDAAFIQSMIVIIHVSVTVTCRSNKQKGRHEIALASADASSEASPKRLSAVATQRHRPPGMCRELGRGRVRQVLAGTSNDERSLSPTSDSISSRQTSCMVFADERLDVRGSKVMSTMFNPGTKNVRTKRVSDRVGTRLDTVKSAETEFVSGTRGPGGLAHTSLSFRDFEVKRKSEELRVLIDKAIEQHAERMQRNHQGQDVRSVRGYFFGDGCTEATMVPVPSVMDDYPTVVTHALRPEVWFSRDVGNDWNAIPAVINWRETPITALTGTKLSRGFTIFTEETTVGNPNALVYRITNGHPWFGSILVMRQSEDYEDEVENIHEDDQGAVENVVASREEHGRSWMRDIGTNRELLPLPVGPANALTGQPPQLTRDTMGNKGSSCDDAPVPACHQYSNRRENLALSYARWSDATDNAPIAHPRNCARARIVELSAAVDERVHQFASVSRPDSGCVIVVRALLEPFQSERSQSLQNADSTLEYTGHVDCVGGNAQLNDKSLQLGIPSSRASSARAADAHTTTVQTRARHANAKSPTASGTPRRVLEVVVLPVAAVSRAGLRRYNTASTQQTKLDFGTSSSRGERLAKRNANQQKSVAARAKPDGGFFIEQWKPPEWKTSPPYSGFVIGRLYACEMEKGVPAIVPLRVAYADATVDNAMVEVLIPFESPEVIDYTSTAAESPQSLSLFRETGPGRRVSNGAIFRVSDFSCMVGGMVLVLKHGPDGSLLHIDADEEAAVDLSVCK
ncbi:hypothetical protein AURDEDRAFT_131262 [Auricularia subglabra TFB-10046 SS5]|uniref:Uncharacterized protein n=1 Tax=Auricularia subglabra (strain TFB-10046 / SS5) TaxID=717982 RepID=J0D5Y9_AURST|nr:hypothetical protein AURDEDRAFT_131262 [Auricularia subglabra TFB-10046 SS5]